MDPFQKKKNDRPPPAFESEQLWFVPRQRPSNCLEKKKFVSSKTEIWLVVGQHLKCFFVFCFLLFVLLVFDGFFNAFNQTGSFLEPPQGSMLLVDSINSAVIYCTTRQQRKTIISTKYNIQSTDVYG